MIISASRRTDLPAFYSEWFFARLHAGYALVRNPVAPRRLRRVSLLPQDVDGLVFWSKDPRPMLPRLDELKDYCFYFQFTLTGYGPDIEPGLPDKQTVLVPAFQRLADRLGPERVIWRYDPILFTECYDKAFHLRCFEALARQLAPYTRVCTLSFLDFYRNTAKNLAPVGLCPADQTRQLALAEQLAAVAHRYGLQLTACAEQLPLAQFGIQPAHCVDAGLLEQLSHRPLSHKKDRNQRPACGCAASVDIGAYDSCRHGCLYCYANHSAAALATNLNRHDPASPLLVGIVGPEDVITQPQNRHPQGRHSEKLDTDDTPPEQLRMEE